MQQLHPRLQAHIRTCMTAQPDPTRTPYEHMVAILIQQVAPGKPEDYLHQTIALIARRSDTQISRLHMQFTEAYDAYRDLCARLRLPPHLGEHFVVTAFLDNLPKDIARDTRNQASAADRLNDLQYVARLAINFDTLARTYPGRGEHRPQDANTLTLNDDFYAPPAPADPPADTPPAAPRAPATPPARRHQRTAPTPSELLQEPPPASWAAAIHHLNQPAPRAPPQPSALNCPVAMTRPPTALVGPLLLLQRPRPWAPCLPLLPTGVPAGPNTRHGAECWVLEEGAIAPSVAGSFLDTVIGPPLSPEGHPWHSISGHPRLQKLPHPLRRSHLT
ncbi:hypothetical protein Emag_007366 [Eimeria magna]